MRLLFWSHQILHIVSLYQVFMVSSHWIYILDLSNILLALSWTIGWKGCFKTGLNRALCHTFTMALSWRLGSLSRRLGSLSRRLSLALLETKCGLIWRSLRFTGTVTGLIRRCQRFTGTIAGLIRWCLGFTGTGGRRMRWASCAICIDIPNDSNLLSIYTCV